MQGIIFGTVIIAVFVGSLLYAHLTERKSLRRQQEAEAEGQRLELLMGRHVLALREGYCIVRRGSALVTIPEHRAREESAVSN